MDFKKVREEFEYKYLEEKFLFGKKKTKKVEPTPTPPRGKEYEGNKIRADINKITAEVKKLANQPGVKEFVNNGITITMGSSRFDLTDINSDVYESGVDEFVIVDIDLWDYKGGNPRALINDSSDGWHPVDHGVEKLRNSIRDMIKEKFPNFYVLDYGGDWDTGSIEIGLK